MTMKSWEARVLASPGARERVAEIEDELRQCAGLRADHRPGDSPEAQDDV